MHWVVAKTKGNRERYAAENVHRQNHKFYLPLQLSYRGKGRFRHAIVNPVFPGYLFVEVDLEWRFLLSTFGITSIVLNGKKPAIMPIKVINAIKQREEEYGYFIPPTIKVGSQVRINSGPFEDTLGIYQGQSPKDRAKVLMDILGGKRTIEMDNEAIALVA
jgi:transcriptional antiterminator RfaH